MILPFSSIVTFASIGDADALYFKSSFSPFPGCVPEASPENDVIISSFVKSFCFTSSVGYSVFDIGYSNSLFFTTP